MKRFTTETMSDIIAALGLMLRNAQNDAQGDAVQFELAVPAEPVSAYPGEMAEYAQSSCRLHTLQQVVDLADMLNCVATPVRFNHPWMRVSFSPRGAESSWHQAPAGSEKYGMSSLWQRVQKLEDPVFLLDLQRSLNAADILSCRWLINLGINAGDELIPIADLNPHTRCMGIDHSQSAIAAARERFAGSGHTFLEMDINRIEDLDSVHRRRYDIFMSLGTLHSPGVDSKRVFMWCMQHLLAKGARVIIGFPNCRWIDGRPVYGAKTKNRRESDMSLVVKDIYFVKKYLQQHKFNVTIFGRYYLFVVGVPAAVRRT